LLDRLCFLDIETTWDGRVTVIGCHDQRGGSRLYVRGHNLGDFVREPPSLAMATFNGGSFDLPVLRRTFPGWQPPALHVDLRTVTGRLQERGGLKAITARWGLVRSGGAEGLDGSDAPLLWARFAQDRDVESLRRLLTYNLYDVVQLPELAMLACEKLATQDGRHWTRPSHPARGTQDEGISAVVGSILRHADRIDPDQFHAEEGRALRTGQG